MRGLLGAIQFLTRIPLRLSEPVSHAATIPWFPVVGVLIGGVVGGTGWAAGQVMPMSVAAAVAVTVGLLVTGAFHEDGLADVADAFGGGWTPEQRQQILKDSRHGTYGVCALVASIGVRMLAAGTLEPVTVLVTFVAAHVLGRSAAICVMVLAPVASSSGLGAGHADSVRRVPIMLGITAGVAAIVGLGALLPLGTVTSINPWQWAAVLAAVTVAGALAVTRLAIAKVGGTNGDVLGATEQVVECLVLVACTALLAV